jgi:hypothetical protein
MQSIKLTNYWLLVYDVFVMENKKDLFLVRVETHSGYKADEYPKRFYLDNIRFEIEEVLDRWYQGDADPKFPAADYFKVLTMDKKIYILKHETNNDKWFLWIRGERINLG